MEAGSNPNAATSLIAYIRKIEARAASMYDDWRGDDSVPWKELPPRDRHQWIVRAKGNTQPRYS